MKESSQYHPQTTIVLVHQERLQLDAITDEYWKSHFLIGNCKMQINCNTEYHVYN